MTAIANQTPQDVATDFATTQFIIQQMLLGLATVALVKVVSCTNNGGISPVGTVNVIPLVDFITQDGQTFPHKTIYKAPYQRVQGGANAIIMDPQAGDLGVCVFASRDSSAVKANPQAALNRSPSPGVPPGSRRTFSWSDALYLGGMLNAAPTQYMGYSDDGITILSPNQVTIQAPTINLKGAVIQSGGDVTMSLDLIVAGTITGDTDVIAGGISGKGHVHPGVQSGSSETDPPA